MSATTPLFEKTQLAEAAYANFLDNAGNTITTNAALITALTIGDGKFSLSQATAFVNQWQVVGHIPDTASGFSATIFRNRQTSDYSLAIRGSTDFTDFSADAALIAVDGIAVRQLVDLYNFWNRSTTAKTQTYRIAQVVIYDSLGNLPPGALPVGSSPYGIVLGDSSQLPDATLRLGTGAIPAGLGAINVSGHSLGGHLAMAFTRLFPGINSNASAVNGLGFKIGNSTVNSLFSILGGAPAFNASSILNVYGIAGPEFAVMNNSALQQPGGFEGIFIENGGLSTIGGHSSVQMTDSAAVYDVFIRLSAQIRNAPQASALATLKPLFEASSAQAEVSLERIVDALVNLLGLDFPPLAVSLNGNRDELYKRIVPLQAITKNLSDNNPGLHVDVLATSSTTADGLALLATGSTALPYRYALKELNPFAIVGNNTLYAPHNQNGELDLYDRVTSSGSITDGWLQDRAAFLNEKVRAYQADINEILRPEYGPGNRKQYVDLASGERITLSNATLPIASASASQIVFGGDVSNVMNGYSQADRLYGEGGADYLRGRLNNDTLEGGRGMDVYEYVGRKSVTGVLTNDGEDLILDVDGRGVLRYVFDEAGVLGIGGKSTATIIRDASVRLQGGGWQSADGKFSYARSGSDLVITIQGDAGGKITLKNFKDGDYGINLFETQRIAPVIAQPLIVGDRMYQDFNPSTPELDIQFDPLGNIIVTEEVVLDVPDTLYGNRPAAAVSPDTPGQLIIAGGGNDTVWADRPNGSPDNGFGDMDRIDAGSGRDVVESGAGNDWVTGGLDGEVLLGGLLVAGGDVINGGQGNDVLFGDAETTLASALQIANTAIAVNATGDLISGGAGNDWVLGGAGRNVLLGGEGGDVVVGGAGNDNLLGDDNRAASNHNWFVDREVLPNPGGGNTYRLLFGGFSGSSGDADGRDVLYGGKGDDWIFAGGADDFIDGGADNDVLFGNGGADVLIGGQNNDVLIGDSGAGVDIALQGGDVLDGGDGNDELQGDGGDDVLLGGAGVDTLRGGEGNDILNGGKGNDIIVKGPGNDLIIYDRGDGEDVVVPVNTSGDHRARLVFGESIKRSDIKFRIGSLLIDLGPSDPEDPQAGNDRIHFEGFNPTDPLASRVLDEIQFADGDVMTYEDILAQGFDHDGSSADDIIDGTEVTDRINTFAGNDDIAALGGDDFIDAGSDDDVVDAGSGNNTVFGGDGNDEIRSHGGNDLLSGDAGDDLIQAGGGNDQLNGGAGNDTLLAEAGDDVVNGGDGEDLLDGGAGSDVLAGGTGVDTYLLYSGMGQDTVTDGADGETNVISIVGGLTADQVRVGREGDALRVTLRGTDAALVIGEYGSRPQNWVLRDAAGQETALSGLIDQPDPGSADFFATLWNSARDGQMARAVGRAHGVGWKALGNAGGGYLFNQFVPDAYLSYNQQTTTTTNYETSGQGLVEFGSTVSTEIEHHLLSAGPWYQASVQYGQQFSDEALIHGATMLSQQQSQQDAWVVLRPSQRLQNFQTYNFTENFITGSYDNGFGTVLQGIRYDHEVVSYNYSARSDFRAFDGPEHVAFGVVNGNRARVNVSQFVSRYLAVNEITAGASANTIVVNNGNDFTGLVTLVDAGAGNDTISAAQSARGLFYGNAGNDQISATGSTIIGGDGNDRLIGCGGNRFVFISGEAGVDQIEDSSSVAEAYRDWYYRGLGITNWQVRDEYAGQYQASYMGVEGAAYAYYNSYEAAFADRPDAVITYVEPLPELAITLRNNTSALSALDSAGVMASDTVLFGPGISLNDLRLTATANEGLAGHETVLLSGGGDLSVRWGDAGFDIAVPDLNYGYNGDLATYALGQGIERFEFADGSVYTLEQLLDRAALRIDFADGTVFERGTSEAENFSASDGDDTFYALGGNDWLIGEAGNDYLDGGDGDDWIDGDDYSTDQNEESGNDVLVGGSGNDQIQGRGGDDLIDGGDGDDYLVGGFGADRYLFGVGDGYDEISADIDDILVIQGDLVPDDLLFASAGERFLVQIRGTEDKIEIYDWFIEADSRLSGIEFANGLVLDTDAMEARMEVLPATTGDDIIGGTNGDDVISGLSGYDELYGNGGIDLVYGGEDDDWLNEHSGSGLLDGGAGDDGIHDEAGAQFIIGGAGNDFINAYGSASPSIIAFNPGDGADTIYAAESFVLSIGGGISPDDLSLSFNPDGEGLILAIGANDSIRLTREYEADTQAWPAITLQLFGSAHLYDFNGAINALYNGTEDSIAFADVLPALEFETSEFSGLGGLLANEYQLHGNLDALSEQDIRDVLANPDFGVALQPLSQGLTLIGTADADQLTGGPGNDLLDGRESADTLRGGAGNDRYVVDQTDDMVIELANEGRDAVSSSVSYTLAANIEALTLSGDADINATGNTLDNEIVGNAGANRLDGKAGADALRGGPGNDTYVIDNINDFIDEQMGAGTDVVISSIDYSLTANLENLTLSGTAINGSGNSAANRLTGNARDNTLHGLGGNDVLNGGAGVDTLLGGSGDDSYVIDNVADQVIELTGEGNDTVQSSVSHTLSDHVDNLTLTGSAANQGAGNMLDNRLTGNTADNVLLGMEGNDTLDGKGGADQMSGGIGDDLYIVDQSGDSLTELASEGSDTVNSAVSWTLGEHFEHLTLTGSAVIDATGNDAANQLTGNNAANTLTGLDGDDTLDGKGGADLMIGGAGNDSYVVAQSADVVLELDDGGIDTVRSSITWTLGEHLEHLVLTGAANIRGYGNTIANSISGNTGNNLLDGGLGADLMAGGAGNDTYYMDDAGDQIVELVDQGVDTVRSSVSRVLEANVENLVLTGTAAISGEGNALANVLSGNAAANTLLGGDGNDIINGGAGTDILIGGNGNDLYTIDNVGDLVIEIAGGGSDTVQTSLNHVLSANVENLVLTGAGNRSGTGNALDNILSGNRGVNTLNGGAGNDTLAGGLGNDIYRFDTGFGHDVIAEDDETTGNIDKIVFGAGITAANIKLGRLNDDLVVETTDHQNSIQIADWFAAARHQIERIEFAGGPVWDLAAIESQAMQLVNMPGFLRGDSDASELLGQIGNTLIEGQGGADILTDGEGNNLFSGGAGDDIATGGDGNDLFVGGSGNDSIHTGGGSNIVAFNAGDGVDTVYSSGDADNTLSLGGGLRYSDLSLSRSSNDLVLNAGATDKVVFKDWYAGGNKFDNLQFVLDSSPDFDSAASDPIYNRRVQSFDFAGMVSAFDAAQNNNPGISAWALGDALTQFHLSGSDDSALGGDLAYWYARNGALSGIGVAAAQQVIGAPGFGAEAQSLREFAGLQDGLVRLS